MTATDGKQGTTGTPLTPEELRVVEAFWSGEYDHLTIAELKAKVLASAVEE